MERTIQHTRFGVIHFQNVSIVYSHWMGSVAQCFIAVECTAGHGALFSGIPDEQTRSKGSALDGAAIILDKILENAVFDGRTAAVCDIARYSRKFAADLVVERVAMTEIVRMGC